MLVGGSHNEMFFDSHWPDPGLNEFLHLAAGKAALDLNPWGISSPPKSSKPNFLPLRTGKFIAETDADYQVMREEMDSLPWIGSQHSLRYRLQERVLLSKIAFQSYPILPN